MSTSLGRYMVGEIPFPLAVQLTDSDGNPIDLTAGFAARWQYKRRGGDAVTRNAVVSDAEQGVCTYTWVADDFAEAGTYRGVMWVGNGSQRIASEQYDWLVEDPPGTPPNV